jgi:hypothetical protein
MLKKLMKFVTLYSAFASVIASASGKVVVNRDQASSVTFKMGCGTFEYEGNAFTVPDEIVPDEKGDKPNCLLGDGSIRNICNGKVLKTLDLQQEKLRIKMDDVVRQDGTYLINPPVDKIKDACDLDIRFKKPIQAKLTKNQQVMFFGNGQLIDQISGKEIKKLKKGVDFEVHQLKDEKIISDEDMAEFYAHNRQDEERFVALR